MGLVSRKKMSFKNVLILICIIISVLPILIVGFISLHYFTNNLANKLTETDLQLAKSITKEAQHFLDQPVGLLNQIKQFSEQFKSLSDEQLNAYLTLLVKNYPFFEMIYILNHEGFVTHMAPFDTNILGLDMSSQDFFESNVKAPVWSPTFISLQSGKTTITLSLPTHTGMIVGYLNLEELNNIIKNFDLGKNRRVVMVDKSGNVLAHSDPKQVLARNNLSNYPFFIQGRHIKEGGFTYLFNQTKYLAAASTVSRTDWLVVIIQPEADAFTPVKNIRIIILLGCLVAMFFAFIIISLSIGKLLHPLLLLTKIANQISKGDYEILITPSHYREINELSAGFQIMTKAVKKREDELKKHKENLEVLIKKRTHELEKAKTKAEAGLNTKSLFLANMSHEIRTPMNSIIGFIDLALTSGLKEDTYKTYLHIARNSTELLLSIINNILDISKLEAGKMQIENHAFHLPKIVYTTLMSLKPAAMEKGLKLSLDLPSELHHCFKGDSHRLQQILINLVGNAIKFTKKGSVQVTVKKLHNDFLEFSIKDTGIGMTPGELTHIFDSFTQADQSTARRYGGTGLGTTICKQLVTLMGGTIRVESEAGKGSVFYFTLPLIPRDCKTDWTPECEVFKGKHNVEWNFEYNDHIQFQSPRYFNILLAEDVEENSTLAIIRLKEQGHQVIRVTNGMEAVNEFRNNAYDVILMDVHMPIMDGLEATRRIRKQEAGSEVEIPIIALTASVMESERLNCKNAGMNDILGKPIDFEELFKMLEKIIPKKPGTRSAKKATDDSPVDDDGDFPIEMNGIDLNEGFRIWKKKKVYLKALMKFADTYSDGPQKIKTLLDENRLDEAAFLSHKLKGVSGNLRMKEIQALSGKINQALSNNNPEEAAGYILEFEAAFKTVLTSLKQLSV